MHIKIALKKIKILNFENDLNIAVIEHTYCRSTLKTFKLTDKSKIETLVKYLFKHFERNRIYG